MNMKKVLDEVNSIINDKNLSSLDKRKKLNAIEKEHPQDIFIKTYLCSKCDNLDVEVWVNITRN